LRLLVCTFPLGGGVGPSGDQGSNYSLSGSDGRVFGQQAVADPRAAICAALPNFNRLRCFYTAAANVSVVCNESKARRSWAIVKSGDLVLVVDVLKIAVAVRLLIALAQPH
jgi:hypothetical protein